jgi:predicted methyltransferase
MTIPSILAFAHTLAGRALEAGDRAVDATTGNGHDTAFLAETVGPDGRVHGFDVQAEALRQTEGRLADRGVAERVTLHETGHERMLAALPPACRGAVGAVTFNLGYLPGSDTAVITRPDTTVAALDAALDLLRPGGVATVVAYSGHDGGAEEAAAVDAWARDRDPDRCHVLDYRFANRSADAPRLVAFEKR